MECRPGCASCCIDISISSALPGLPGMPGMPNGKPAGVRCVNLNSENLCLLHGTDAYPAVCRNFKPSSEMCGKTNEHAIAYLQNLEKITENVKITQKNNKKSLYSLYKIDGP